MPTTPAAGPPGLFVVVEGGDGAGKSTQAGLLAAWLREQGREVVATREPGGTALGARIRELLLHGEDVAPRAEALLFAADRAHHVETVVRPALERGAVVVCDRFMDSSIAYQGAGRDLDPQQVRELSLWATGGLLPDLTVLLDVPAQVARARVGAEPDRMEREAGDFHARVRTRFLALAQAEPDRYLVLDATSDPQRLAAAVRERVAALGAGSR